MVKSKGGIPDRWKDYYPMGEQVAGTRFIAFKVPLKDALCRGLGQQERFTPSLLLEHVPRLGLVIDLTNTSRYYSSQELECQGVAYQKLDCPGHAIPPKRLVCRFYNIVNEYIQYQPDPDYLIGVHCTHGLNRTSFFVCSYMVEQMGMTPQEALTAFQEARGYNVERENYVKELMTLKPLSAPPLRNKVDTHKTQQHQQQLQYLQDWKRSSSYEIPQQVGGPPHHHGYQRKRYPLKGASKGRPPHVSASNKQMQMFVSQTYNNTGSDRIMVVNDYSTEPQQSKVNSGDGAQGAMTSRSGDYGDRSMASVNKYMEFGNKAKVINNKDNFSAKETTYSRGIAQGRFVNNGYRGMSVNTVYSNSDLNRQFVSEYSMSQKGSRYHAFPNSPEQY
ncbi:RNA/RNP complex-1-interacting phosphatase [Bacillus rossius redtenbacheri]|uniref:RNA/RNP complex-1-interacting phosphatase n=1 Tax=Bacillus rossius redtenbacheri TaxID=93214 RepID=UPI002FDD9CB9